MKRKKISLIMMTFIFSIITFAEKINVQEATEMALKNNKSIKIQMLEVEKSKIEVDKAWKNAYFNIGYTASIGRFFDTISPAKNSYTHSIALTQPIYAGGKVKTGIEIGKKSLDLSELTLDKVKKDTILNTVEAYINVYDAQNTLDVYKLSKKSLDKNYETQKEKYDLRMVTKPDLLEAEKSVKEMESIIISQEATLKINKETLGNLIGISGENIEIVPFTVNEKFTNNVNLKDDLEKLKTVNTEYQIMLKLEEINEKNIKIEKGNLMPTVAANINYGTLQAKNKFSELRKKDNYSGMAGINFSWTIFDWDKTKLSIENAEKTYEISKIKSEQTLNDLKTGLKGIYYKLQSLEKSLEAQKIAVEIAEENYKLETERYNERLITMTDLLVYEKNLRQAKTNYLSSTLNYYYLISKYGAMLD